MTITYSNKVASVTAFGVFWKLLFRWKGSVYKHIWPEFLLYLFLYISFSLIYSFGLSESGKEHYEYMSLYFRSYVESVPMTFVLGFYVNLVVTRWWGQYKALPWPDNLAIFVSNSIQGRDVRTRMMRRTIVRYANLAYVLTLRTISPSVHNRFPSFDQMVDQGFLLEKEKTLLEEALVEANGTVYWVPLVWAVSLIESARKESYIPNNLAVKVIVDEIANFRASLGSLLGYDKISIPLAYTQVVTLAVYSYLLASLVGRQFLAKTSNVSLVEMYMPLFSLLQVLIYLGWLKVAESLVNPFGSDDEDFDLDGLIDRNIRISYLIADKMLDAHPELSEDKHWNEVFHNQALLSSPPIDDNKMAATCRCEPAYHRLPYIDDV